MADQLNLFNTPSQPDGGEDGDTTRENKFQNLWDNTFVKYLTAVFVFALLLLGGYTTLIFLGGTLLLHGASVIAFAMGFTDSLSLLAIPKVLLTFNEGQILENVLKALFVGMADIWLSRLLVSPIGNAMLFARGLNPFEKGSLLHTGTTVFAEWFEIEIRDMEEETVDPVPYLKALSIKLVLIAALFVFGSIIIFLVAPHLPPLLAAILYAFLLAMAICLGLLAEIPSLVGPGYDRKRKMEKIYGAEDTIEKVLYVLAAVIILLSLTGLGLAGLDEASGEVLGADLRDSVVEHYYEKARRFTKRDILGERAEAPDRRSRRSTLRTSPAPTTSRPSSSRAEELDALEERLRALESR